MLFMNNDINEEPPSKYEVLNPKGGLSIHLLNYKNNIMITYGPVEKNCALTENVEKILLFQL